MFASVFLRRHIRHVDKGTGSIKSYFKRKRCQTGAANELILPEAWMAAFVRPPTTAFLCALGKQL